MYFLDFGEIGLAGASPEMLVRVEGNRVQTRPIAGTRPRGRNEDVDRRMEEELRSDPKERAEHVMLVDLGRNDLGRVSTGGSVEVTRFMGALNGLADQHGVGVLLSHHTSKTSDDSAVRAGSGTTAWVNATRAVLKLTPSNDTELPALKVVKANHTKPGQIIEP